MKGCAKRKRKLCIEINFDNDLSWKWEFGFELVFRLICGFKQEMEWKV